MTDDDLIRAGRAWTANVADGNLTQALAAMRAALQPKPAPLPLGGHTAADCSAAFEWLRAEAVKPGADPRAGVALDAWHAAASGVIPQAAPAPRAEPTDEEIGHVTIEQARAALDSMDDFARMKTGVDAMGPRRTLEVFIAQAEAAPAAPAPQASELEKAHEARRQAQREAEAIKERMARTRLDLMRELREQGWTPPAAQPAPAAAAPVQPLTEDLIADIWHQNAMNPTVYGRAVERACAAAWGVTLVKE